MRWRKYDPGQYYFFDKVSSLVKRKLIKDPDAIIFKGSRTTSAVNDYSDIDMIVVKEDVVRSDKSISLSGIPRIDMTIIGKGELEKNVCSMHSDTLERTALLDLSYVTYEGSIEDLEDRMNELIIEDFQRFVSANYHNEQKKVYVKPMDLLLYPLMLDLHRMPTLFKSAGNFLVSPFLYENLDAQAQEFVRFIKDDDNMIYEYDGRNMIFDSGASITDTIAFPKLKGLPMRNWPEEYYLFSSQEDIEKDYTKKSKMNKHQMKKLEQVDHFIRLNDKEVLFDLNFSDIISCYRE